MAYGYFTKIVVLAGACCSFFGGVAGATIIDFDSTVGGAIGPGMPYTEKGYTFTNPLSSTAGINPVLGPGGSNLPGDTSLNFLALSQLTTLTLTGQGPFNLESLFVGRGTFSQSKSIDFTIKGFVANSSTILITTFLGLNLGVTEQVGFQNLQHVEFSVVDGSHQGIVLGDAGLDNIVVTAATPEPSSLFMFGFGLAALAIAGNNRRTRRGQDCNVRSDPGAN